MNASRLFDLTGKTALITGAAQGLGHSMALGLAQAGARVAILDRDVQGLEEIQAALQSLASDPLAIGADVTDGAAMERAIQDATSALGRLDIVIPNAGISETNPGLLHEMPREDWSRVTDINLNGVYNTIRPALTQMMTQASGKLILIASMFGVTGAAGLFPRPAYAASKGAIVNLTRELALEYAPHNIQVNAILPGFFKTKTRPRNAALARDMAAYTPMGRIADADEIQGSAIFLASSASDFMTGNLLAVDGGVLAR